MIRPAVLATLCALCAAPSRADDPHQMTIHADIRDILLLARGDYALMEMDITVARRLLETPARDGVAEAARGLAQTFDPVWLVKHGAEPVDSFADPEQAYEWYKRAAELGDAQPGNLYLEATK
jgi:TPR repeat protein